MILSQQAQEAFNRIKNKIEIKAIDFKGTQIDDLSVVYFEITKHSTGKGRILSKGCSGCIPPAVNICYNYLKTIPQAVTVDNPAKVTTVSVDQPITVQVDDWNDLTKAELMSQCKSKGIKIPHNASKSKLIDLLCGIK